MENKWDYLMKGLGPACLSYAAFYAYKKYLHVPLPFTAPIVVRKHMVKGKQFRLN